MAGYRFKIEEKALLVNAVKMVRDGFEAKVKENAKKGDEMQMYASMRQHQIAGDVLAKLEGNFNPSEA